MLTVREMMTPNPHTLFANNTLYDAKQIMQDNHIRHIPIVSQNGELEGLISQRDILSAQSSSIEKTLASDDPMKTPLSRFINDAILSVNPQAGLKMAACYMQDKKIGCLPVVDKKRLVGIITDADFVAIAINLLELQEEQEPLDWEY